MMLSWAKWSDERLLGMRLSDLHLHIHGTWLERPIRTVLHELDDKGLKLRPHFWLSEEWFSPGGIAGVALPFYLAHPRLMKLERKQMLEVEGGNFAWCMKILRHEIGHAMQHGFELHRRRGWQEHFGKSSTRYPTSYVPKPKSKRYVQHLDLWYAQSHPDEDFAETFAVWLKPRSPWRTRYAGWPALKKLRYVDELMDELRGKRPSQHSRAQIDPISRLRKTIGSYYEQKRAHYGGSFPDTYDRDLKRLFPKATGGEAASMFLRRNHAEIRELVGRWTGEYQFTLDQVMKQMIGRARQLRLRAVGSERQLKLDFAIMVTVQSMHYLYSDNHKHPV